MALSTWPSTGPVDSWMEEMEVPPDAVILGWVALYWDGGGSVNTADIYSSVVTPWSTLVNDPELLPSVNLQCYLLFYRYWGGMYCVWLDGYDTYFLPGKTLPVTGILLSDQKWAQMQNKIRDAWSQRSVLAGQYTDWTNEV